MNQFDTLFVAVALGLGVGIGASFAKSHGILGFAGGFFGTVMCMMVLLGGVRLAMKRGRSRRRKRE